MIAYAVLISKYKKSFFENESSKFIAVLEQVLKTTFPGTYMSRFILLSQTPHWSSSLITYNYYIIGPDQNE